MEKMNLDKHGNPYVDFVVDYETLANKPDSILLDGSVIPFVDDPHNPPTFMELVESGFTVKFDRNQEGRVKDPGTIKWWASQPEEAKQIVRKSDKDVDLYVGHRQMIDFIKDSGVNFYKSNGWCRGNSFDFPIMVDVIRKCNNTIETTDLEPIFWGKHRDIRTAIEENLGRGVTMTPLRKGILDGFIPHNSLHDCAKDILSLLYARRYAWGLEDMPEGDDIDPKTIK